MADTVLMSESKGDGGLTRERVAKSAVTPQIYAAPRSARAKGDMRVDVDGSFAQACECHTVVDGLVSLRGFG